MGASAKGEAGRALTPANDTAALGGSSTDRNAVGKAHREYVEGEILVRFKPGAERAAARRSEKATLKEKLPVPGVELVKLERGRSTEAAVRSFERRSDVLYAEPNYVYEMQAAVNDSRFGEYWGLNNRGQTVNGSPGTVDADMDVPEAWNIQQSSPNVVVAVIDTGIAYDHPDLAPSMWSNPGEACTAALPNRCKDGVDSDGNGYIDDVRGYDFVNSDADPRDDQGHGSHVAGTIAARGNNDVAGAGTTDGTGVSTQGKLQALKVLGADGTGSSVGIIKAITYAGKNGAKVANMSLGGGGASQAQSDAIKAASGTLFIIAAGNGGPDGVGDDNDAAPTYPCSYTAPPNIVCVAATDQNDKFTSFSNYGATAVDVAAPGQHILSTAPAFRAIWSDNFATDPIATGRWTRGGTPNTWGLSSELSSNGTPIPSLADSPNANYAANQDNWARRTAAANLTGMSGCSLNWYAFLDIEPPGTTAYDWLSVEVATSASGPWTELAWYGTPGQGSASNALGQFNGKSSVYVRYRFKSDSSGQYDGAYVINPSLNCVGTSYNASDFTYKNGTSMATPNVAGVAALMYAKFPAMTVAQGRTRLLQSVDVKASLNGTGEPGKKIATGGRVNAYKALSQTTASVASGVLAVTAGKGSTNNLVVAKFTDTDGVVKYRITDAWGAAGHTGSRVLPGAGCVAASTTTVKCVASGITRVKVVADDLNDSVNTSTVTIPVTIDGGLGNDTLTSGAGADTLIGGAGADRFSSGGGSDTVNARDEVLDTSFACGESTGDSDTVNADLEPNDPVAASATNCEVVNKL